MESPEERQQFDGAVRLHVYTFFLQAGRPPTTTETAEALKTSSAEADAAYHRLADAHMLVLTPGTSDVRMANPLSAVPTPFRVEVNGRWWWGSCIWDSLGIPPMLGADGRIMASCGDGCGEPIELVIQGDHLLPAEGVLHFALPAARWWDDIIYN